MEGCSQNGGDRLFNSPGGSHSSRPGTFCGCARAGALASTECDAENVFCRNRTWFEHMLHV